MFHVILEQLGFGKLLEWLNLIVIAWFLNCGHLQYNLFIRLIIELG